MCRTHTISIVCNTMFCQVKVVFMFTSLSIIKKEKTLLSTLFRPRSYVSEIFEYKGCCFYTTALYTLYASNEKSIKKFGRRAELPILTAESPIVTDYKYIITANTLFYGGKTVKSVGVYDPDGRLCFLPDFLAQNSGCIMIFTRNSAAYEGVAEQILTDYGTPIIFTANATALKKAEIIFSFGALPFSFSRQTYGYSATFADRLMLPNDFPPLPDYCDPFIAAAGLYFICKMEKFGALIEKAQCP